MSMHRLWILLGLSLALAVAGCGDDGGGDGDAGEDAGGEDAGGEDAGGEDAGGEDAGGEDAGGEDAGDGDAGMGGDYSFRDDAPDAYMQVDRMGMPVVATALVTSDNKTAYNEGSPANDFEGDDCPNSPTTCTWGSEFVGSIQAIHDLSADGNDLDAQLSDLGLTPCEGDDNPALPPPDTDGAYCALQALDGTPFPDIAPGTTQVYELIIPDELTIDTSVAAADRGFPNGRALADPVADITLAVVLLDMADHTPATFTDLDEDGTPGPSLNPLENDVSFKTEFPYVADPHTP